jgi:hypothetical protein
VNVYVLRPTSPAGRTIVLPVIIAADTGLELLERLARLEDRHFVAVSNNYSRLPRAAVKRLCV